jgi:hypothetical protein
MRSLIFSSGVFLAVAGAAAAQPFTAITGATLVDVSAHGSAAHDVADAVVVMQGDRIIAAGPATTTAIPPGAKLIDRRGRFIVPGLVDGFAGLQSQAEANAMLYEGVTTVVASQDDRRGHLFPQANPAPHIYPLDGAGSTDDWSLLRGLPAWRDRLADHGNPVELPPAETSAQLKATAARGTRVIWVGWNITAANARAIIAQSHALHMATYGEFIATPYSAGIADGVDALLHMSRYELGLAPEPLIAPLATDPGTASGDGPAVKAAYNSIETVQPGDPAVSAYGDTLARANIALIPTFSLFYLILPDHQNLWRQPAAKILDPAAMTLAPDPATGEFDMPPAVRARREQFAAHVWALNTALHASHPVYLAASGASTLGAMPGISMHVELSLLVRLGLSPREALAAATSNYADKFGWRELGEVAPGRRADLLIVSADPTRDITNIDRIEDVVVSGQLVDRAALLKK